MNHKKIFIFTDLDGSLLHRDNFSFNEIKNFIKKCFNKGMVIVPNSSKTKKEIENFCDDLNLNLPFISENGSSICNINLINPSLPKEIILSRKKEEIRSIFNKNITKEHKLNCKFIKLMPLSEKIKILGLSSSKITDALDRNYSHPLIFLGSNKEKNLLIKNVNNLGLKLHEGDRVLNLGDNVAKGKAMKKFMKLLNIEKFLTIAVGDSKNDIDMLEASDFPCLVYNKLANLSNINTKRYFLSKSEAPLGWSEVIDRVLTKIN
ncbi:MAG: hypothetical protein CMJ07_09040 [Pelagibacterales bacterium]|nr:hypothetical protein [Pelagibacterales bacterium]|tara:strand:+ start:352 stop:1140 length:789 start_codon:yes stop_codon:yes gene_type:complete